MPSEQPLPIAACEERRAQPAPRSAPGSTEARPDELGSAPAAGDQRVLERSGRPRSLFPQQIRPLPERAKIKLMALLPRCPATHKLLCPLDFDRLNPRLARSSRRVEKLLRPEQRMRDGEVLRRYCVPSILLVQEFLLDGS